MIYFEDYTPQSTFHKKQRLSFAAKFLHSNLGCALDIHCGLGQVI